MSKQQQQQHTLPSYPSSFQMTSIALFAGMVFVLFLGLTGIGIQHPPANPVAATTPDANQDASPSPDSEQTPSAETTSEAATSPEATGAPSLENTETLTPRTE